MMRALLAAALLAVPMAASAQTATPDAATLAAAREVMKVSDVQGQLRLMGPQMADAVAKQIESQFAGNSMPAGLQTQVTAALRDFVGSMDQIMSPAVIDEMAVVYARNFSAADLTSLAAMLKEPVMVRFREQTPAMMAELMPVIFKAMRPRQEAFNAKLKAIIADWIKTHPEDKAKFPSPTAS
ncbi:MAG: DUF2059 domain-containing protein [Sphingobium sp.]